jgi:hypothetical protein
MVTDSQQMQKAQALLWEVLLGHCNWLDDGDAVITAARLELVAYFHKRHQTLTAREVEAAILEIETGDRIDTALGRGAEHLPAAQDFNAHAHDVSGLRPKADHGDSMWKARAEDAEKRVETLYQKWLANDLTHESFWG